MKFSGQNHFPLSAAIQAFLIDDSMALDFCNLEIGLCLILVFTYCVYVCCMCF